MTQAIGPAIVYNLGFPVTLTWMNNETELEDFYNANYGAIWNGTSAVLFYHSHNLITPYSCTLASLAVVFLSDDLTEYAIRTNATYLPQNDSSSSNSNPFSFLNAILSNTTFYIDSGVILLQQVLT